MRRFRSRGHSRWEVRHFFTTISTSTPVAGTLINEIVVFTPELLTSTARTTMIQKDWTVTFKSWCSDYFSTNAVALVNPITLMECLYVADINPSLGSLYGGGTFLTNNEISGVAIDPRAYPRRILFRRGCQIAGLNGASASALPAAWSAPPPRGKVRLNSSEAIFWRAEALNPAANAAAWTQQGFATAAIAVKANP